MQVRVYILVETDCSRVDSEFLILKPKDMAFDFKRMSWTHLAAELEQPVRAIVQQIVGKANSDHDDWRDIGRIVMIINAYCILKT